MATAPVGKQNQPEGGRAVPTRPRAGMPAMLRRDFLRLAGMSAAGVIVSACSASRSAAPTQGDEPVQLVYQDWRTRWFPPMAQEMLERFHAAHPEIRVFYVPAPENFQEQMLADFAAGTAPDVFQGCRTHFPSWAQMGYAVDLRPFVEAHLDQATIADWDPAQYRAFFTRDGRQFGLPKYHGALALYYNKDLFDEYGVDYPDDTWDHDDYLAAMQRLTHDRDGDGEIDLCGSIVDVSWDRIQVHVNAWAATWSTPTTPGAAGWPSPRRWQPWNDCGPASGTNASWRRVWTSATWPFQRRSWPGESRCRRTATGRSKTS